MALACDSNNETLSGINQPQRCGCSRCHTTFEAQSANEFLFSIRTLSPFNARRKQRFGNHHAVHAGDREHHSAELGTAPSTISPALCIC
jgi:hypothetical protein